LIPVPETSYEEEERGNVDGVGASRTRTKEEKLANLKRRKDSF